MDINLTPTQRLTQTISPQYLQTLNIIQMSSIELSEHISKEIIENPVLDMDNAEILPDFDALLSSVTWLSEYPHMKTTFLSDADGKEYIESLSARNHDTLQSILLEQISPGSLSFEVEEAVKLMIYELNGNGYFESTIEDFAKRYNIPHGTASKALSYIKTLEPAGVGAADLSEQLVLQLKRNSSSALSQTIADRFLTDMAAGNFSKISKQTGASRDDVLAACEAIRSLDPRPCRAFGINEASLNVTPDIVVDTTDGQIKIIDLKNTGPSLHINALYADMLKTSSDPHLKDYLNKKLSSAKQLIASVEQRRAAMASCAASIVNHQREFFFGDSERIAPLKYADVADDIGVHESTVCRIVRRKYLLCSKGLFSFKHFFGQSIKNPYDEDVSSRQIKAEIAELIKNEDPGAPLSDQAISDMLKKKNINAARRTVAKYRSELNIPSTKIRGARNTQQ